MVRQRPPVQSKHKSKQPKTAPTKIADSFSSFIKPLIPAAKHAVAKATLQSAPLARLEYETELQIKNKALELFWEKHKLAGQPNSITPSPLIRKYRTTSKRKILLKRTTAHLLFGEKSSLTTNRPFLASPLEPHVHTTIYQFLQAKLSEEVYNLVARHLNYLIIRGNYREQAIIFNVDTMNGPLVRKMKNLAALLQKKFNNVNAAYIYLDPSKSAYYLESKRPTNTLNFKKLFGPAMLSVTHEQMRYRFDPTSFSQVNESIVPKMLNTAKELLAPEKNESLLDLYCGYGLFSLYLAPDYKKVVGIDVEGPSIRGAITNNRSHKNKSTRFLSQRITKESVEELLSSSPALDSLLLDPPKQGPEHGVIQVLAKYAPKSVLHIFCGVDQIPASLAEWRLGGYQPTNITPLDMFPGTANLEVLVLLKPCK